MSMWRQGTQERGSGSIQFGSPDRNDDQIGRGPIFANNVTVRAEGPSMNSAPDWVDRALLDTGIFDQTDDKGMPTKKPVGINNTEWRILVRFCVMRQTWEQIADAYGEQPSRVRFFAESAARRLFPERAITAQAAALGHEAVAIMSDSPIVAAAETLYSAVNSPFGETPEGLTMFFRAIAEDPVVVKMLRDHIAGQGVKAVG